MVRTLLRAMMVAAMFATLLVPAVPAAAAGGSYTLHTNPINITRSGRQYQMTIAATQDAELSDSISVTLSKVSDPAGVAKATQSHTWSWNLTSNSRFVPVSSLDTATLGTASEMGSFGNIRFKFDDVGSMTTMCNRTLKKQPGNVTDASVTFNTGTALFGKITARPATATLYWSNGPCSPGGHNYNSCPPAGYNVFGYRTTTAATRYLSASKNATGPANIMMMAIRSLGTTTPGSKSEMISAEVPREDVVIGTGLAAATVTGGEPGTWFTGQSRFAATGAAYPPGTYDCGADKEVVSTSRPGLINGNLTAPLFTGTKIVMPKDVSGTAGKTAVRAR